MSDFLCPNCGRWGGYKTSMGRMYCRLCEWYWDGEK